MFNAWIPPPSPIQSKRRGNTPAKRQKERGMKGPHFLQLIQSVSSASISYPNMLANTGQESTIPPDPTTKMHAGPRIRLYPTAKCIAVSLRNENVCRIYDSIGSNDKKHGWIRDPR